METYSHGSEFNAMNACHYVSERCAVCNCTVTHICTKDMIADVVMFDRATPVAGLLGNQLGWMLASCSGQVGVYTKNFRYDLMR